MQKIQNIVRQLGEMRGGIPQLLFMHPIEPNASVAIRKTLAAYKKEHDNVAEVDFIINSPGGLADDAYRIIRSLRGCFKQVNIIVPFWAKSAATLLSLGGSKIVMDEFGEFGPLDAQVAKAREDSPEYDRESALNDEHSVSRIETRFKELYESMYIRLYEHEKISITKNELSAQLLENLSKFYQPLLSKIDPYKLGEKRRTLDIGSHYANRILRQFHQFRTETEQMKVRLLVDFLVDGCPDHGYIVDYDVMSKFLDFVETGEQFGGEDYASLLDELSRYLFEAETEFPNFIGFVKPDIIPTPEKEEDSQTPSEMTVNAAGTIVEDAVKTELLSQIDDNKRIAQ